MAALEQDLIEGHCGKLPPAYLKPMMLVQRLTDISMARVLLERSSGILLAGNGHIRKITEFRRSSRRLLPINPSSMSPLPKMMVLTQRLLLTIEIAMITFGLPNPLSARTPVPIYSLVNRVHDAPH